VKSKKFVKGTWHQPGTDINIPRGLAWTDAFLMKVSKLTGKPIPESPTKERGRLVDMMTDTAMPGCTARSSPSTAMPISCWG